MDICNEMSSEIAADNIDLGSDLPELSIDESDSAASKVDFADPDSSHDMKPQIQDDSEGHISVGKEYNTSSKQQQGFFATTKN